ncbi:neprilysin-4 [Musca domestica]|uniref:Membrane metallo-endopeptidase-like 1 n=1 Tax=Musca domestica TaxID=7370 RepID=A0A1I8N8F2_MUSDO|nr:neprilysin-4 [Musca domestica]
MLKFYFGVCLLGALVAWLAESRILRSVDDPVLQSKAKEMLKYMNMSVDPCEDFYEFTCGNWNRYHSAELENEPATGLLETLQKSLDQKLIEILSTEESKDTAVDKKIKDFYKSCLNLPNLEKNYAEKLKKLIAEFGEMPALVGGKWQEDQFDWLQTIGEIYHKYGIGIITSVEVAVDLADNSVNRLYFNQQDLTLEGKAVYSDNDKMNLVKRLTNIVASRLVVFLNMDVKLAIKTAKEIVQFEADLARGVDEIESVADFQDMVDLSTLEEAQEKYGSELDLKKLVELSFGSIPPLKVYISETYTRNLIEVMKKTPPRQVANFIFYKLISKFLVSIPEDKDDLPLNCLSDMKTYFSKIFDNMVYRKYKTQEIEQGIRLMWHQIKEAFRDTLESQHYNWISPATRKYAVEKLGAMEMDIVSYQDYDFNDLYVDLKVDNKDYVENLKSLYALGAKQNRESINEEPQPIDFGDDLSTTPSNILIENVVKVPVNLLQSNYVWSSHYPNAFNFGVLGSLLSHELIHGFDDTGRNHGKDGNALEWWDPKSSENFNKRSQCFNSQYQGFVFHNKHLPDMPAQGENIADNGGVRLAYSAYLKWLKEVQGKHPSSIMESMPGMKFSDKQLFFVSYGQLWCGDVNPVYRQLQESTDTHVPDKFRVIGPLSNFEEFAKEFQCPAGSGMNPYKKCEIY